MDFKNATFDMKKGRYVMPFVAKISFPGLSQFVHWISGHNRATTCFELIGKPVAITDLQLRTTHFGVDITFFFSV